MVRRFAACHWSGVMWNKLRDWYLALIGIIVIAGGLYIASHSGSNDGSVKEQAKQTESVSSASEAAKAPRAPDQSQTSPGDQPASTTNAPPTPPSLPQLPIPQLPRRRQPPRKM